jgi:hypothetical protein
MKDNEESTEERVKNAFDLYEHDIQDWDADIFLDELEMLYDIRERINRIILQMKRDISLAMECKSK